MFFSFSSANIYIAFRENFQESLHKVHYFPGSYEKEHFTRNIKWKTFIKALFKARNFVFQKEI